MSRPLNKSHTPTPIPLSGSPLLPVLDLPFPEEASAKPKKPPLYLVPNHPNLSSLSRPFAHNPFALTHHHGHWQPQSHPHMPLAKQQNKRNAPSAPKPVSPRTKILSQWFWVFALYILASGVALSHSQVFSQPNFMRVSLPSIPSLPMDEPITSPKSQHKGFLGSFWDHLPFGRREKIHPDDGKPFGNPLPSASVSSPFGPRWGRLHQGTDLAVSAGTIIHSAANGQVVFSGWKGGYGQLIEIQHENGYVTRYGHCQSLWVKAGDSVLKGQPVGRVGSTGSSTGPHLHFEIHHKGSPLNPQSVVNLGHQPTAS